jgi:hypothetical protein
MSKKNQGTANDASGERRRSAKPPVMAPRINSHDSAVVGGSNQWRETEKS